jgi:hypothetical protein
VVNNLKYNLDLNQLVLSRIEDPLALGSLSKQIQVEQLDWNEVAAGSPDALKLLTQHEPDIVVACDTVYLPEHLSALAATLKFCLGIKATADSESYGCYNISSRCPNCTSDSIQSATKSQSRYVCKFALLAQTERNPQTYSLYLKELRENGLHIQELLSWPPENKPENKPCILLAASLSVNQPFIASAASSCAATPSHDPAVLKLPDVITGSSLVCPLFRCSADATTGLPVIEPAFATPFPIDCIPQRFAYKRHHTQRLHLVTLACPCLH